VLFVKNIGKCGTARQTTDDNIHDACILYADEPRQEHSHTLVIRNIYCFSTATVFAGKRLNNTLYVHCFSCSVRRADVGRASHKLPSIWP